MADIQFYDGDGDDSSDGSLGDEYDSDTGSIDAGLTPLQKLEKYMSSEHSYSRQLISRSLLETLKSVEILEQSNDAERVLQAMVQMSDDLDSAVRLEMIEQLVPVALHLKESLPDCNTCISTYLQPIVIKFLIDSNTQVRKSCHVALLNLMKDNLISEADVEHQFIPCVLDLTNSEAVEDLRTEACLLLTRMASLVEQATAEKYFLQRFSELCNDALFHVRKVCALNFGEMCKVVGQQNTEKLLLGKFMYLCEDGVWGVRNACAECFALVSSVCSAKTRREDLAQVFVGLICDQSRWVRMAAFQALGGFISTFADSSITGIEICEDGSVIIKQVNEDLTRKLVEAKDSTGQSTSGQQIKLDVGKCDQSKASPLSPGSLSRCGPCLGRQKAITSDDDDQSSPRPLASDTVDSSMVVLSAVEITLGSNGDPVETEYTSFNYWRVPVLDITQIRETGSDDATSASSSAASAIQEGSTSFLATAHCTQSNTNVVTTSSAEQSVENLSGCISPKEEAESGSALSGLTSTGTVLEGAATDGSIPGVEASTSAEESTLDSRQPESQVGSDGNVDSTHSSQSGGSGVDDLEVQSFMDVDKQQDPVVENVKRSKIVTSVAGMTEIKHASENTIPAHVSTNLLYAEVKQCGAPGMQTVEELKTSLNTTMTTSESSTISSGSVPDLEAPASPTSTACMQQVVIPKELLEHYLGMSDPQRAQTVDTDILQHCAYSFPAVAYTLGRNNWPCIKDLYENLVRDMQWKVRRTLAFSLHKLAVILGEAITSSDLVPVFDEFLKDLDEVRIGILMHLAEFLKLLPSEVRQNYLVKLPEFLKTDNSRNWRFRKSLAEQMLPLLELFSPTDIINHLTPMALSLADDKVAQVRLASLSVLSGILRHLSTDTEHWSQLKSELTQRFAMSIVWCRRQMFALLCGCVLDDVSVDEEKFCSELLPLLLTLSADAVPNVRLTVARALVKPAARSEYFTGEKNKLHPEVQAAVESLACDTDSDVRRVICSALPHLAVAVSVKQSPNDTTTSVSDVSDVESHSTVVTKVETEDDAPVAGVTLTDETRVSAETSSTTSETQESTA